MKCDIKLAGNSYDLENNVPKASLPQNPKILERIQTINEYVAAQLPRLAQLCHYIVPLKTEVGRYTQKCVSSVRFV